MKNHNTKEKQKDSERESLLFENRRHFLITE
jgi:hypothetical protein